MVVLIEAKPGAGAIDLAAARELASLGVTSVSVVHDEAGVGVVLEGWAFDPAAAGEQAAAILGGGRDGVRTLHSLLQAAVSAEQPSARAAARTGHPGRGTARGKEAR